MVAVRDKIYGHLHAVLAPGAPKELGAWAQEMITCDTIEHPTNRIAVAGILADAVRALLEGLR